MDRSEFMNRRGRTCSVQSLWIACVWLTTCPNVLAQALDTVRLAEHVESYALGKRFAYLEDHLGKWTVSDVRSRELADRWRKSQVDLPNSGLTDSVYWFAVELVNTETVPIERLLAITYPLLDSIEVYLLRHGRVIERIQLGDQKPFAQRLVEHRHFLVPIFLAASAKVTLLLRVQTSGSLQLPATLWTERAFWKADEVELIAQGLYFGIMLVMILYNLFIFTAVHDRSYVYSVLFVSCFTLAQLMLHGFAFQFGTPIVR
jgi:diguanylate cyclase